MRAKLATAAALLVCALPAQAGAAVPEAMRSAAATYARTYATEQGWLYTNNAGTSRGDFRRAYFEVEFLANPAPATEHCYDDIIYVDSCPEKVYEDDGPFYMDVETLVVRCARGRYVVSTPLDLHSCERLPRW
jgi:hypothetical protein